MDRRLPQPRQTPNKKFTAGSIYGSSACWTFISYVTDIFIWIIVFLLVVVVGGSIYYWKHAKLFASEGLRDNLGQFLGFIGIVFSAAGLMLIGYSKNFTYNRLSLLH